MKVTWVRSKGSGREIEEEGIRKEKGLMKK
jgi:hypothetical protein